MCKSLFFEDDMKRTMNTGMDNWEIVKQRILNIGQQDTGSCILKLRMI